MSNVIQKFLDDVGLTRVKDWVKSNFVPTTRKINDKALGTDISLTASDVGAVTQEQMNTAIQSAVSDSWTASY